MNRTDVLLADASVWTAAVDPEDRFHGPSRALVLEVGEPVAALDLTLYEIANSIGVKKRRVEAARNMALVIAERCGRNVATIDADLFGLAVEVAAEHGLTAYDAAYVAAARRNGWTLVSGDLRDLVHKGLAIAPDAALYP